MAIDGRTIVEANGGFLANHQGGGGGFDFGRIEGIINQLLNYDNSPYFAARERDLQGQARRRADEMAIARGVGRGSGWAEKAYGEINEPLMRGLETQKLKDVMERQRLVAGLLPSLISLADRQQQRQQQQNYGYGRGGGGGIGTVVTGTPYFDESWRGPGLSGQVDYVWDGTSNLDDGWSGRRPDWQARQNPGRYAGGVVGGMYP